jgi:signal transduction histidine kinase
MLDTIQTIGKEVCQWYDAPYYLFSGNVFSNLIYYSHIFPALAALLIGCLIYFSNKKALINRVLFFTMMAFVAWTLIDLMLWATERVDLIMFSWSSLAYIEPLIYIGLMYVVYIFVNKSDMPFRTKLLIALALVPILFLAPTAHNLVGFDFTNCDREGIEGPLWKYIYILEFVIVAAIATIGFRKSADKERASQNKLITIGSILFLVSLSLGNIVGSFSENWSIAQYGLFGMPVFIVFLSYLVIRYQRFNTKVFATQILSGSLSILVLSLMLIEDVQLIHLIVLFTFGLTIAFGYLLNISVIKEHKQKTEIEMLAKNLEQTNVSLEQANDKLKGLDKLKTEFLSLASHQLRSPLTAIKGYSSMLIEGTYGKLNAKIGEPMQRIYTSAQGLVSIVEDLLNVSKIEQGGMKYEMMPTDLAPVVTTLFHEMEIPAQGKHIAFSMNVSPDEKYMVQADPTKIKQVLLNLVDNSIKYTPEKGAISISLVREADHIVFAVTDNGVGISPETKAKLFEKFSRGEGGKVNTGGSGLGLYLAKQIAIAHKGDVIIQSEGLGKGSTFKVVLPAL